MVIFEAASALTTAKPIVIAGMTTYLLDKSGFDFSQLPMIGQLFPRMTKDSEEADLQSFRYFCCFHPKTMLRSENLQISSTENTSDQTVLSPAERYVPTIMAAFGIWDVLMGGVLLSSMYMPVDQPLKLWVLGGLGLGFPTTALIYNIAKKLSFRHAFLVESTATMISFGWLSYGILIVSKSTAYKTSPLLFWAVYGTCVTSWSLIGTSLLGLIVTTVVAMSFGSKPAIAQA